jgi:hypothetical protein
MNISEYKQYSKQYYVKLIVYLQGVLSGYFFRNVASENKHGKALFCQKENPLTVPIIKGYIDEKIKSGKFSDTDSIEILFVIAMNENYPCDN